MLLASKSEWMVSWSKCFFMLCWSNPFSTFSKWVCQITSKLSGDETDLNTLSSSQKRTFALSLAKVLSAADRGLSWQQSNRVKHRRCETKRWNVSAALGALHKFPNSTLATYDFALTVYLSFGVQRLDVRGRKRSDNLQFPSTSDQNRCLILILNLQLRNGQGSICKGWKCHLNIRFKRY